MLKLTGSGHVDVDRQMEKTGTGSTAVTVVAVLVHGQQHWRTAFGSDR